MPIIEPITLTLAELASRWNQTPRQLLEQGLPMYFYFDGLVFDFSDKWLRANGDVQQRDDLDSYQARLATVTLDLQRQTLHQRGLLKLTQWEESLSEEGLRQLQAEADHLSHDIAQLTARLQQRTEQRQRQVRNGLLRAAPRTLREIAQRGSCAFPQFAYLPATADQLTSTAIVALEDGFPVKTHLTAADLVLSMLDVRTAEG